MITPPVVVRRVKPYDLTEMVSGMTPENIHPETLTGAAVGAEFPKRKRPARNGA